MADEEFDSGPTKAQMIRQMTGATGMIEDDSQMNGEFTENRGKTVWEDGLIAHGLKEAPGPTGSEIADKELLEAYLKRQENEKKKREVGNSEESDLDEDEDDDALFDLYKSKRMLEMKTAQRKAIELKKESESMVKTIIALDFNMEVVEASEEIPVVLLIYRGSSECNTLNQLMRELAGKFKKVKFLRVKWSQHLKGVPIRDCPIMMVYRERTVIGQYSKLRGFAGPYTTARVVEWELAKLGILDSDLKADPRAEFRMVRNAAKGRDESEDESED
mmetsp:Transcript_11445/g.17111  ORF Transcript_11445/g.17111 Transcript_11445/m.17111 type:complete len:275 (-) Transcript_11445:154-978(-)